MVLLLIWHLQWVGEQLRGWNKLNNFDMCSGNRQCLSRIFRAVGVNKLSNGIKRSGLLPQEKPETEWSNAGTILTGGRSPSLLFFLATQSKYIFGLSYRIESRFRKKGRLSWCSDHTYNSVLFSLQNSFWVFRTKKWYLGNKPGTKGTRGWRTDPGQTIFVLLCL